MIEQLREWLAHPYVAALLAVFVGCYILRDVVRAILYVLDSSRRPLGNRKERAGRRSSPR